MTTDLEFDLDSAMRAGRRRKSRTAATKCRVKQVRVKGRGTRYMLLCPHKRAKFISEARAKSFRRR